MPGKFPRPLNALPGGGGGAATNATWRRLLRALDIRTQYADHLRPGEDGRLALKTTGPLFFNKKGELDIRTSGLLEQVSNSPTSLTYNAKAMKAEIRRASIRHAAIAYGAAVRRGIVSP